MLGMLFGRFDISYIVPYQGSRPLDNLLHFLLES